jgi:hypothetical protein
MSKVALVLLAAAGIALSVSANALMESMLAQVRSASI